MIWKFKDVIKVCDVEENHDKRHFQFVVYPLDEVHRPVLDWVQTDDWDSHL